GMFGLRVRYRVGRLFGSSKGNSDPDDEFGVEEKEPAPAPAKQSSRSSTETPESPMTQSSPARPSVSAKEGNGRVAALEPTAPAPRNPEDKPDPGRQESSTRREKSKRSGRSQWKRRALNFLKLAVLSGAAAAILYFGHSQLRI